MSARSVIGRSEDDQSRDEPYVEVSSPREGRDSVNDHNGDEQIPTHSPQANVREPGLNTEQVGLVRNLMGIFEKMPAVTATSPVSANPIFSLKKMGAEKFYGNSETEPSAAEDWLEATSRVLKALNCTPAEKVQCVETLLQGEAYRWWEMVTGNVESERITWDFFVDEFNKEYVGDIYKDQMRAEFIALRQRGMSVNAYYTEFKRLSKYAKEMVSTNKDKCSRFLGGLNKKIHNLVIMNRGKDFAELVQNAKLAEESLSRPSDSDEETEKRAGKRIVSQLNALPKSSKGAKQVTPSHSRGSKSKNRTSQLSVAMTSTDSGSRFSIPKCKICSRRHMGECRKAAGVCFNCGSEEHFVRDCLITQDPTVSPTLTLQLAPSDDD